MASTSQLSSAGVSRIVAVTSCKGGVGKSTVSLGLALALRNLGLSVGLLDADVHGPSLPSLLGNEAAEAEIIGAGKRLRPIHAAGIAAMSWGYLPRHLTHVDNILTRSPSVLSPADSPSSSSLASSSCGATVLRGRETARVAVHLALGTQWNATTATEMAEVAAGTTIDETNGSNSSSTSSTGSIDDDGDDEVEIPTGPPLDVLVVDMPPGTGDVSLGLLASLPLTGAVVVTSPSQLAVADVEKGMEMLARLEVPLMGIVENFAWQEGGGGGFQSQHHQRLTTSMLRSALQQWLPQLSPEGAAAAQVVMGELDQQQEAQKDEQHDQEQHQQHRCEPFGPSNLAELLDLARRQAGPAAVSAAPAVAPRNLAGPPAGESTSTMSPVEGFQLPLCSSLGASAVAASLDGGQSARTTTTTTDDATSQAFAGMAAHVWDRLQQEPTSSAARHNATTLQVGDKSVSELQSWHRFLHRLKHNHYTV